jgi:hypothetical protein
MSSESSPASTTKPGRTLTIVGAVLAVVGIFFLPIVFGPVGAILGFVAQSKGDKPAGMYVGIAGIAATIIGMVLGAIVFSSMTR